MLPRFVVVTRGAAATKEVAATEDRTPTPRPDRTLPPPRLHSHQQPSNKDEHRWRHNGEAERGRYPLRKPPECHHRRNTSTTLPHDVEATRSPSKRPNAPPSSGRPTVVAPSSLSHPFSDHPLVPSISPIGPSFLHTTLPTLIRPTIHPAHSPVH